MLRDAREPQVTRDEGAEVVKVVEVVEVAEGVEVGT